MNIDQSEIIETEDFKVIIFAASRPFLAKEAKAISEKLFDFLASWNAHGAPLSASFKIERNQFVVVCVDEEKVATSGCSLDALSRIFKELDAEFNLGFMDSMKVSYLENGVVKTMALPAFKKALKSGEISSDIEVFDFSKNTYVSYLSDFLLPLKKSWAGAFI